MPSRLRLLSAFVAVTAAAACVSHVGASILFGTYTPATTQSDNPSVFLAMNDYLSDKGPKASIRVIDIGWNGAANQKDIELLADAWRFDGVVPVLEWMPYGWLNWTSPTPDLDVVNGVYDAYIDSFLVSLRDTFLVPKYAAEPIRRRVYLAFAPQPNNNWAPWSASCPPCSGNGQSISQSPADYVKMWDYVVAKIRDPKYNLTRDLVQVVFVASAVDESGKVEDYFTTNPATQPDWVAVAGMNFGTSIPGNTWVTPQQLIQPMMARLQALAPNAPVMLSEIATTSFGNGVTAKEIWIENLFSWLLTQKQIKIITYYNADSATDFAIFGGQNGVSSWASPISNMTYWVYPAFRNAVSQAPFIGCNHSSERYISNRVFFGQG